MNCATENPPLALLTFYKCGSQWIRDLLTDSVLLQHLPGYHAGIQAGKDAQADNLPILSRGTINGPLYQVSAQLWEEILAPAGVRGLLVLRDPRDIAVSLLHSWLYSHRENEEISDIRKALRDTSPVRRIRFVLLNMPEIEHPALSSWATYAGHQNLLRLSYEDFVADTAGCLMRVFELIGRKVPDETVASLVARHSFSTVSGRNPGQSNQFSHLRKGMPGDWKNHFSKADGEEFERIFPGLLVGLGYETGADWVEALPSESPLAESSQEDVNSWKSIELQAEILRKEEEIRRLVTAGEDRLKLIDELNYIVHFRDGEIEQLLSKIDRLKQKNAELRAKIDKLKSEAKKSR